MSIPLDLYILHKYYYTKKITKLQEQLIKINIMFGRKKQVMSTENYLDKDQKIKAWPSKKDAKIEIVSYLSEKFEYDVFYTEKQVNEIINEWHTFRDYFLLRRELIEKGFLNRTRDGSQYWKVQVEPKL